MTTPLSRDTSLTAERVLLDLYRALTPAQKLHAIVELQKASDQLALAGIRRRHPDLSAAEQRLRLAALKYSRALMVDAFGWDPETHGY
jgi:hypothetical protein